MDITKCRQCGKDVNSKSAVCPFCGGRLGEDFHLENPAARDAEPPWSVREKKI